MTVTHQCVRCQGLEGTQCIPLCTACKDHWVGWTCKCVVFTIIEGLLFVLYKCVHVWYIGMGTGVCIYSMHSNKVLRVLYWYGSWHTTVADMGVLRLKLRLRLLAYCS